MKIYRIFRLVPVNELPAGAVLEGVIIAPNEGIARGCIALEDHHAVNIDGGPIYQHAQAWLDADRTRAQLLGETTVEHDDDLVDGDQAPYVVMTNRQAGTVQTHG